MTKAETNLNIKNLAGKPLISWSIEAALAIALLMPDAIPAFFSEIAPMTAIVKGATVIPIPIPMRRNERKKERKTKKTKRRKS